MVKRSEIETDSEMVKQKHWVRVMVIQNSKEILMDFDWVKQRD